jgi:LAO/AO transport system kinase
MNKVWDTILSHHHKLTESGEIATRRAAQARAWMWSETSENLMSKLRSHPQVRQRLCEIESAVTGGLLPPTAAAKQLLDIFLGDDRDRRD